MCEVVYLYDLQRDLLSAKTRLISLTPTHRQLQRHQLRALSSQELSEPGFAAKNTVSSHCIYVVSCSAPTVADANASSVEPRLHISYMPLPANQPSACSRDPEFSVSIDDDTLGSAHLQEGYGRHIVLRRQRCTRRDK